MSYVLSRYGLPHPSEEPHIADQSKASREELVRDAAFAGYGYTVAAM
jgi:hypothetical protein